MSEFLLFLVPFPPSSFFFRLARPPLLPPPAPLLLSMPSLFQLSRHRSPINPHLDPFVFRSLHQLTLVWLSNPRTFPPFLSTLRSRRDQASKLNTALLHFRPEHEQLPRPANPKNPRTSHTLPTSPSLSSRQTPPPPAAAATAATPSRRNQSRRGQSRTLPPLSPDARGARGRGQSRWVRAGEVPGRQRRSWRSWGRGRRGRGSRSGWMVGGRGGGVSRGRVEWGGRKELKVKKAGRTVGWNSISACASFAPHPQSRRGRRRLLGVFEIWLRLRGRRRRTRRRRRRRWRRKLCAGAI